MDDAADAGAAERAFEALRAEVAALRQAVAGQTAPDYALTLGEIVKELQAVGEGFERGRDTLARVAFFQQRAQRDRNILWAVGGGAALIGAILGVMLFMEINRHA